MSVIAKCTNIVCGVSEWDPLDMTREHGSRPLAADEFSKFPEHTPFVHLLDTIEFVAELAEPMGGHQ